MSTIRDVSLNFPFRSFDTSDIPSQIIWIFVGWGIGKGLDELLKIHPIKISKQDITSIFTWFKMAHHFVLVIVLSYFSYFSNKTHLRSAEKKLDKIIHKEMILGFWTFFILNPQLVYKIFKVIIKTNEQKIIDTTTGVNTKLEEVVKEVMENTDEIEHGLLTSISRDLS